MTRVTLPGYPRIGHDRELKRATERFWKDPSLEAELTGVGLALRERHWREQAAHGVDLVPAGDFSYYDTFLDAAVLFGCVPERYRRLGAVDSLAVYFAMARGTQDLPALEMTKWFDTNYHYIVPEIGQGFTLHAERLLAQVREARALGLEAKPVVPGPYTFLRLSHLPEGASVPNLLRQIAPVYRDLIGRLAGEGVGWIALDEPALVLDGPVPREEVLEAYETLGSQRGRARLLVQAYFEDLGANRVLARELPVDALGVDLVRGPSQWEALATQDGGGKTWVAGVVDGRNVWRSDLEQILGRLEKAKGALGDRLMIGPSCSLLHLPYSIDQEPGLDPEIRSWIRFAEERLAELSVLKRALDGGRTSVAGELAENRRILEERSHSVRVRNPEVRRRIEGLQPSDFARAGYEERRAQQARAIPLPALPTTTIGSFPQTPEVRSERNRFRTGKISRQDYEGFVDVRIREVIKLQEDLGLDVLVHGEFERTDMVEYFAEQLEGMLVSKNGWVQSYGTRYVRPPLIFGDVHRSGPMTVRESRYAQSLTQRPVKGMLTGPVTILNWSFVRDDLPREQVALQIGAALRDETRDLEAAGIRVVQIDEPALREGVPLRASGREPYLKWSVRAFRLSAAGVKPSTQVHTHMCYSEFNEYLSTIADLDADVISIENSRSSSELLKAFDDFKYPRGIGPGVYDVHSERIVPPEEMEALLERAGRLLPHDLIWVNPDCGLKTRRNEEVIPTIRNMVEAARRVRARWQSSAPVSSRNG